MTPYRLRRFLRHGTLPQLAAFEAVARLGSCSRAAEALHLSQPAVSGLLRKLAESLGVPLFEQVGRRLVLTPAGEEVYAAIGEIFGRLGDLDERLEPHRSHGRGTPCPRCAGRGALRPDCQAALGAPPTITAVA